MLIDNLVSVIMPAYNAESTIGRAIESVLNQTYQNLELIITNNNSTDNTLALLESYAKKDPRIIILNNDKKGVSNARNTSIEKAKGEYIAFLDADDYWTKNKLDIQISNMKIENYYVSHSSYVRFNPNTKLEKVIPAKNIVRYDDMLKFNHIGNLTGIYNSKFLGKQYQKNIGHEDFEMWLNLLKKTDSIGIDTPLAYYLVSESSISSNKIKAALWHLQIIKKHIGLSHPVKIIKNIISYSLHNIKKRT